MANNYDVKTINSCADSMIEKILDCLRGEMKKSTYIDTAIVNSVNEDGTVNVYFPPDNSKIFTKISNQTPFQLEPGDGVELLLKDGSYSNCWVIAKHGATLPIKKTNISTSTSTVQDN